MTSPKLRPARLVLIRHAESARNHAKKGETYFADEYARSAVEGVPDYKIPLTPRGHEQARQTGVALRERFGKPDYVFHSGYLRTKETTEGILTAYTPGECSDIKVRMNHFVRERDAGYTYDMLKAEAEAAFPWLQKYWDTHGGFISRPPGGESLADVATRVQMFLNKIFREYTAGKTLFVVTHGGTLRCFRFLLEGWSYEQALKWPPGQSPENCGVTLYEYAPALERLVLRSYNECYWQEPESVA